jgi:IS4 transposase
VEILDKEKQESIVFLSNLLAFGATTIAAIYKDRWQVELFFKALKQTLKIKTFVGTSANAVRTQVWTALIAMLVLKYLQLKSKYSWSLSTLAALLRQQLFFYAYSERCRSPFRGDGDRDSELMPITIPR